MTTGLGRPYPGPKPFSQADSHRFFGRRAESAALADLWRTNRLTLASGAAGSGKTSLLCAGVLPLVEGGRAEVMPTAEVRYGSSYPTAALPEHNPYTFALLASWSPGTDPARLAGVTVSDFVRRHAGAHDAAVLAVIDDTDQVLGDTGLRRAHRRAFLGELAEAVRTEPRLHLLLLLRDSASEDIPQALSGGARFGIRPLTFDGAVEAVTGPAELMGRAFAAGAAEGLVTDLLTTYVTASAGEDRSVAADRVQPVLLQVACTRLWEDIPPDVSVITERDVRRYGSANNALVAHCSLLTAQVADDHGLHVARLRSWLLSTFVTEFGTCGTTYQGITGTSGMPNAVLRELEDRHLLCSEPRSGSRWYRLLSERLIEPLRRAVDVQVPAESPAEYLTAATRALTWGDLDLAERRTKDALRTSPEGDFRTRAEASSMLGNLSFERGKPSEAEARFREAASLFEAARETQGVAHQLAAVGQTLVAQGRYTEAATELKAAVERLPNDLLTQSQLGWALWHLGQSRAAQAVFTGILAVDAGNADALRGRGEILADLGDAVDAIRDLSRVRRQDRPSTRAARGLAMAELGEHAAAGKEIEEALAKAPRNGPVLLYAARAEALSGDETAAAELAGRAVNATDPPLPQHQRLAAERLAE